MSIQKVGVVGAGTMGNGIAQACAMAGLQVMMIDVSETAALTGKKSIDASLGRLVNKDKLSAADRAACLSRVHTSVDYASLADADLVIEAATENVGTKLRILEKIDAVIAANAIIATNTSSISITQLAAVLKRPSDFLGMHFFNPVPVMVLLEVIRGLQTSEDTHARALQFAQQIGKVPISAKNSPGFAVNRILVPMINEAIFVLQEGLATAEDIDAGMRLGCNHPIGPLALADLIGLDTLLAVMQVFYEGFNDPKYRPAPLLKEMVAAGRIGRKAGGGFYSYS